MAGTDWSTVDIEKIQEMQRLGEKLLEGQLAVATAADQRAMTLATMASTILTAIVAGVIALFTQEHLLSPLSAGGAGAAVAFLAATVCCTVAAWPDRDWFLPGNEPDRWCEPDVLAASMNVCLGGEVENYQSYIDRNARHIKTNAIWLQAGLIAAALAPVAAAIPAFWLVWAVALPFGW